jgi:predicted DNA binding CopG/RHH family protein
MSNERLISNVNIRLNIEDMNILKQEASKLRIPLSTYCRTKLTEHIEQL